MSPPLSAAPARPPKSNAAAFADGLRAASASVFMIVLVGSYISIGALAHDLGFPVAWVVLSTILIWAAPAQVILITSPAAGTAPLEAGIAVGLSTCETHHGACRTEGPLMGFAEFIIGPAHRVRPLAGPMAGSGRTRWLYPSYADLPSWSAYR